MRISKLFINFIVTLFAIQSLSISLLLITRHLGSGFVIGKVGTVGFMDFLVPLVLIFSVFYFYKARVEPMLYIYILGSFWVMFNFVFF
ncbi:hypothetical protein [Serpentinicella alkaliphila]|uniref:Uncharacterized protein n=1 Tax=Serpentinicella alkaliphila TaxID=1734049 RepID=A0A4R2TLH1_9FIRM|nr:hypothetical protein [Serpentinicella alkaliphila]QUH26190.1 hypothetical protein HZR23_10930 [Serpentinicella alkaliphila]TCP95712.1 hypothetical protein EDD79_10578 [Serpentinicella alkaliphila]